MPPNTLSGDLNHLIPHSNDNQQHLQQQPQHQQFKNHRKSGGLLPPTSGNRRLKYIEALLGFAPLSLYEFTGQLMLDDLSKVMSAILQAVRSMAQSDKEYRTIYEGIITLSNFYVKIICFNLDRFETFADYIFNFSHIPLPVLQKAFIDRANNNTNNNTNNTNTIAQRDNNDLIMGNDHTDNTIQPAQRSPIRKSRIWSDLSEDKHSQHPQTFSTSHTTTVNTKTTSHFSSQDKSAILDEKIKSNNAKIQSLLAQLIKAQDKGDLLDAQHQTMQHDLLFLYDCTKSVLQSQPKTQQQTKLQHKQSQKRQIGYTPDISTDINDLTVNNDGKTENITNNTIFNDVSIDTLSSLYNDSSTQPTQQFPVAQPITAQDIERNNAHFKKRRALNLQNGSHTTLSAAPINSLASDNKVEGIVSTVTFSQLQANIEKLSGAMQQLKQNKSQLVNIAQTIGISIDVSTPTIMLNTSTTSHNPLAPVYTVNRHTIDQTSPYYFLLQFPSATGSLLGPTQNIITTNTNNSSNTFKQQINYIQHPVAMTFNTEFNYERELQHLDTNIVINEPNIMHNNSTNNLKYNLNYNNKNAASTTMQQYTQFFEVVTEVMNTITNMMYNTNNNLGLNSILIGQKSVLNNNHHINQSSDQANRNIANHNMMMGNYGHFNHGNGFNQFNGGLSNDQHQHHQYMSMMPFQ